MPARPAPRLLTLLGAAGTLWLMPACHSGGGPAAAPQPDFTLMVSPVSLSLPAGGGGHLTVTATRSNGQTGAILLALEGAPLGVVGSATVAEGAGSVRMSLTAAPSSNPQTLSGVRVVGTSGALTRSVAFTLTVTPALPVGPLGTGGTPASGGPQQSGATTHTSLAGEPLEATTGTDPGGTVVVRHGFHPVGTN